MRLASHVFQVDFSHTRIEFWEQQVHACLGVLAQAKLVGTDELRRTLEGMDLDANYANLDTSSDYYLRWAIAMAKLCLEKGLLSEADLNRQLGLTDKSGGDLGGPRFQQGDRVIVRPLDGPHSLGRSRWRRPHLRTPGYIFGQEGTVERLVGSFPNPSLRAYGQNDGPDEYLYRVRFSQPNVWRAAGLEYSGGTSDTVDVEIYDNWLLPWTRDVAVELVVGAQPGDTERDAKRARVSEVGGGCSRGEGTAQHHHAHSHAGELEGAHAHGDGDGGAHQTRAEVEQAALDREGGGAHDGQVYAEALIGALVSRKVGVCRFLVLFPARVRDADTYRVSQVITRDAIRKMVETIDALGAQQEGARLVARAWQDPAFKALLLHDGNAAARQIGIDASNVNAPIQLTVVENTANVHNLVVCTLCSCYPAKILGLSPQWYKSRVYRARAVREPRAVLAEFGTELAQDVSVRVHDSTADCRYLVLPGAAPSCACGVRWRFPCASLATSGLLCALPYVCPSMGIACMSLHATAGCKHKSGMSPSPSLKSVPVADSMLVVVCAANLTQNGPRAQRTGGKRHCRRLLRATP